MEEQRPVPGHVQIKADEKELQGTSMEKIVEWYVGWIVSSQSKAAKWIVVP